LSPDFFGQRENRNRKQAEREVRMAEVKKKVKKASTAKKAAAAKKSPVAKAAAAPAAESVERGSGVQPPIEITAGRFFGAVFPCHKEGLARLVPHDDLKPVELFPGWGAVAFGCFEFTQTSIGPYLEFAVSVPVRYRPYIDIPLIPLFNEEKFKDYGMWIHRLPNSTQTAVDAGIEHWGYPKFLADMKIEIEEEDLVGTLEADGENIFTLRVRTTGLEPKQARSEMSTFSIKDNELLRTTLACDSEGCIAGGLNKASIRFGSHKFGLELGAAGVKTDFPLQIRYFPTWSMVLPRAQMIFR
jgi:hypothetical protein